MDPLNFMVNNIRKGIEVGEDNVVVNGRSFHINSLETTEKIIYYPRASDYSQGIHKILNQLIASNANRDNSLKESWQNGNLRKIVIKQDHAHDTAKATHLIYELVFLDKNSSTNDRTITHSGTIILKPGDIHGMPQKLELEVDKLDPLPESEQRALEYTSAQQEELFPILTINELDELQEKYLSTYLSMRPTVIAGWPKEQQMAQRKIDEFERIPPQQRTPKQNSVYWENKRKLYRLQSVDSQANAQRELAKQQIAEGEQQIITAKRKWEAVQLKIANGQTGWIEELSDVPNEIQAGFKKFVEGKSLLALYTVNAEPPKVNRETQILKLTSYEQEMAKLTPQESSILQEEFDNTSTTLKNAWEDDKKRLYLALYGYESIPFMERTPAQHASYWQTKHRLARPQAFSHQAESNRKSGEQFVKDGLAKISAAKPILEKLKGIKETLGSLTAAIDTLHLISRSREWTDSEKTELAEAQQQFTEVSKELAIAEQEASSASQKLSDGLKEFGKGKAYLELYTPTEEQTDEWNATRRELAVEARAAFIGGGVKETILASTFVAPIAYAIMYSNRLVQLQKANPKEKIAGRMVGIWIKTMIAPVIRPLQTLHLATVGTKGFIESQVVNKTIKVEGKFLHRLFKTLTLDSDFGKIDQQLHAQAKAKEEAEKAMTPEAQKKKRLKFEQDLKAAKAKRQQSVKKTTQTPSLNIELPSGEAQERSIPVEQSPIKSKAEVENLGDLPPPKQDKEL